MNYPCDQAELSLRISQAFMRWNRCWVKQVRTVGSGNVLSGQRYADTASTPLARSALSSDRPAKPLHQGLRDGEAQSRTRARAGAVGAVEALEDVRQIGRPDADTRITHTQHRLSLGSLKRNDDATPSFLAVHRRVLDRVVKQDQGDPAQAPFVATHTHRLDVADL